MNQRSRASGWAKVLVPSVAALAAALLASCSRTESVGVSRAAAVQAGLAMVSDEFDLDHPPFIERGVDCAEVAFGATIYLVTHAGRIDQTATPWRQLAFTRFDRNGQSLDRFGVRVATVHQNDSDPTPSESWRGCAPVVFDGTKFITLWSTEGQLRCARITEAGALLDAGGVATGISSNGVDSATFDGANVLASMRDGTVALLGTDCAALGAPVPLPATAGAKRWRQGAAFDGTQHWVAYAETQNGAADRFLLQAVSTSGTPSGTPLTVASAVWVRTAAASTPYPTVRGTIAAGGGKTVVAYNSYARDPIFMINRYAELSSSGVLGNEKSLPMGYPVPTIVFAGDGFVVESNWSQTNLQKVLDDGTTLSHDLPGLPWASTSSLASDGTKVFMVRLPSEQSFSPLTARTQLVGGDLQPLTAQGLLREKAELHRAAVVASGTEISLSVWRREQGDFYGSRLSAAGTVLDEHPLSIHTPPGPLGGYPSDLTVASDGKDFLVAWGETNEGAWGTARSHARLVKSTGEIGASFVVSEGGGGLGNPPGGYEPAVASNGSGYLVVWNHLDGISDPDFRYRFFSRAARVSSTGTVLDDPPLELHDFSHPPEGEGFRGASAVVSDGADYLVAVQAGLEGVTSAPLILRRVSADGSVGIPLEIPWEGSGHWNSATAPALAWGAGQGLVVFADENRVLAVRVSAALEPLDVTPLLVTEHRRELGNDVRISAAWDGTSYWISWKDGRSLAQPSDELYVARVSPDGVVLDPAGVLLSRSDPVERQQGNFTIGGGVLASGDGRVLAAYTRFDAAPEAYNFVLRGRWLSSTPGAGGGSGEAGAATGGSGEAGMTGGPGGGSAGTTAGGGSGAASGGGGSSAEAGGEGGEEPKGGTAGATHAGGSGSGGNGGSCRMGARAASASQSLFWLAVLGLPLWRRARRHNRDATISQRPA
jgi:hypothetical protein